MSFQMTVLYVIRRNMKVLGFHYNVFFVMAGFCSAWLENVHYNTHPSMTGFLQTSLLRALAAMLLFALLRCVLNSMSRGR